MAWLAIAYAHSTSTEIKYKWRRGALCEALFLLLAYVPYRLYSTRIWAISVYKYKSTRHPPQPTCPH